MAAIALASCTWLGFCRISAPLLVIPLWCQLLPVESRKEVGSKMLVFIVNCTRFWECQQGRIKTDVFSKHHMNRLVRHPSELTLTKKKPHSQFENLEPTWNNHAGLKKEPVQWFNLVGMDLKHDCHDRNGCCKGNLTIEHNTQILARGIQRKNSKDFPSKGGLQKEQSA